MIERKTQWDIHKESGSRNEFYVTSIFYVLTCILYTIIDLEWKQEEQEQCEIIAAK